MTRSSYRFIDKDKPHFLTSTVVEWLPLFSNPDIVDIVLTSLRFLQKERGFVIYAYVILENHIHLIASSDDLSKTVKEFESFTATQIVKHLEENKSHNLLGMLRRAKLDYKTESKHQVGQEWSHLEEILSENMMRQKIMYIHNNPVKRGYVDDELHWRYSSSRNDTGEKALIEVKIDCDNQ
jgi:REP element-mobilizing transposase RayT